MISRDWIERLEERICLLECENKIYVNDGSHIPAEAKLHTIVRAIKEYLDIEFKKNTGITVIKKGKESNPDEPTEKVGGIVGVFTCPKCNHVGEVDVSPHVYFDENKLGFRCKKCKHVWEVDK